MSDLTTEALSQLDDSSKKEIMQWVEVENSKAKVRTSIHNFTDMCFKKCINKVDSSTLNRKEEDCLQNCLNAFLDVNIQVLKNIQQQKF